MENITPEIELKSQKHNPREWAKAIILFGSGIYFLVLIVTGNLSNYVNLRFAWLSYVAAIIFFVLGIWSIVRLLTGRVSSGHSSVHLPIPSSGIFIVGLPLIFATLLPSQPLGADAISGGISLEPVGGISSTARYNVPPLERNVLDWLREFDAVSNPAELEGLPVDIVAFVYREPDMPETQFMAARFTLSCCVADAFAVGMPVESENALEWADGAWVRIQGRLSVGEFRGAQVPIIIPDSIEETEIPQNPYLYS